MGIIKLKERIVTMKKVIGSITVLASLLLVNVAYAGGYGGGGSLTEAGSSVALFVLGGIGAIVTGIVAYRYSRK